MNRALADELLEHNEREEILQRLDEKQRDFLTDFLRRGKRTAFANVLAREKAGGSINVSIKEVVDNWELVDHIDAGPNWKTAGILSCECGRSLRYQYIVENRVTREIKRFGKSHFAEHMGIPAYLARKIINGMDEIDFELDEILVKVKYNWSLDEERIYEIDPEIKLPKNIKGHLDSGSPLLGGQVRRLHHLIYEFRQEQRKKELERERLEREAIFSTQKQSKNEEAWPFVPTQQSYDFNAANFPKAGVVEFLKNLPDPEFNASSLCEYLVRNHGAAGERYSSGRLKIVPEVCTHLNSLVQSRELELIGKTATLDHIYRIK